MQINEDSKSKQLKMWLDIISEYCKFHRIHTMGITELYNSPISVNAKINRRLSMDALKIIITYMIKNGITISFTIRLQRILYKC